MGKVINIISLNVKLAAHKSFYNLATMSAKVLPKIMLI